MTIIDDNGYLLSPDQWIQGILLLEVALISPRFRLFMKFYHEEIHYCYKRCRKLFRTRGHYKSSGYICPYGVTVKTEGGTSPPCPCFLRLCTCSYWGITKIWLNSYNYWSRYGGCFIYNYVTTYRVLWWVSKLFFKFEIVFWAFKSDDEHVTIKPNYVYIGVLQW